ncbi:hypothetical protein O7635_14535 [Asanoa sp. WMMD1127]|uniref:hypothetical protein n=1 Tax=Asanoa sp. WMMD1127 TaxID=3016107 RepID=UPI002415F3F9|nr:hypothetical protein [Asanoa sp. WMMD1127]MDG4823069.1 hypothetical protein [Asanoa sp. WMMD1127]
MSDDYRDPSGNTEAFRAFAARQETPATSPEPAPAAAPNRMPLIIGGLALAVIVIIVLVFALT